jgi:hypothetical protein
MISKQSITAAVRKAEPSVNGQLTMRGFAEFGCTTSDTDVDGLFAWYETAGFLYPQKYNLLKPYIEIIRKNWRKVLDSPTELMFLVRRRNGNSGGSSISSFRSSFGGWNAQHLVSVNDPLGSMAAMLSASAERYTKHDDTSQRLWFRPENKFPARVFGSMVESVGPDASCVDEYAYCTLQVHSPHLRGEAERAETYSLERVSDFAGAAYIRALRGPVFSSAEGYSEQDISLERTDELYREAGLSRKRFVYTVFRDSDLKPVGYCAAYRGPLGLNLSFLENRSEICVDPSVPPMEARAIVALCVQRLKECYCDYQAAWIPVLLRPAEMSDTEACGLQRLRRYRQGIWIRDGFERWYEHVQNCFAHVLDRRQRAANRGHA